MQTVTPSLLASLQVGFQTAFQGALDQAPSQYERIASVINSTSGSETYGWLGKLPNVREWVGDRVIQNLKSHAYAIKNTDWELTIGVDRNDIEDDNLGQYAMLFAAMGESSGAKRDMLTFGLLNAGFSTNCYDGQFFFDTDHPVIKADGLKGVVSNMTAGAGPAWFLLDTTRAIKPLIFQSRKTWEFVARDQVTDHNVFTKKEFHYGTDARFQAGYGLWQMAHGSKATLDAANYEAARTSMTSMAGDHGRPLGIKPNLLVVPPSLEGAARTGFDYAGVRAGLKMAGLKLSPDEWADFRHMEIAALNVLNEG